jgi:branched-chain amino acid transport system substrate-binding protein
LNDYKAKTGHAPVFIEPQTVFGMAMVADALKRTKPEWRRAQRECVREGLETTSIKTPMGEMSMRAADHQVQLPMVVSDRVQGCEVQGSTTPTWASSRSSAFSAQDARAVSCAMKRPAELPFLIQQAGGTRASRVAQLRHA